MAAPLQAAQLVVVINIIISLSCNNGACDKMCASDR